MSKKKITVWKIFKIFGLIFLCFLISAILLVQNAKILEGNLAWFLDIIFGITLLVSYINLYYYIKKERKDIFKKIKKNSSFNQFSTLHEIQKVNHGQFFLFFWKFKVKDGWELNSSKIVQIISWVMCIILSIASLINS